MVQLSTLLWYIANVMVQKIRAHFDGKAIIPEEPLKWPVNQPMTIQIGTPQSKRLASEQERNHVMQRILARGIRGLDIPINSLRRESIYHDKGR